MAVYTSFVGVLLIASAVLAVDIGRLSILRTQMQNAADAAALAAAAQLDRQPNARARAEDVALYAAVPTTTIALGAATLQVDEVRFFSSMGASPVQATNDQNAAFVRVTLVPREMNIMFQPVMSVFAAIAGKTDEVRATATATSDPFVCHAPTTMVCDISSLTFGDIMSPAQAGRQLAMRQRVTGLETVSFRMLCPPHVPGATSCGITEVVQFGAAANPNQCGGPQVSTLSLQATAAQIDQAFNPRFIGPNPAVDVVQYPSDASMTGMPSMTGAWGAGNWNRQQYWSSEHPSEPTLPPALAGATRYQVYLYELGLTFARNGAATLFPVPPLLPPGFVAVDPHGPHPPLHGAPPMPPYPDPHRRVVRAAVVNCAGANLSQPLPTQNRLIDLFLTQRSSSSVVYAEIIGPVSASSAQDFHANTRLVQ